MTRFRLTRFRLTRFRLTRFRFQASVPGTLPLLCALTLLTPAVPVRAQGPAPTPAVVAPSDYVLSPDDQLDISVRGHEDFKASVTVLPDGTFNYPVVGKVHAVGQTVDRLTALLVQGLSSQLNQPQVTVTLHEGRPRKVSVLGGAVKSPGQYDCRTGMHLLDLVAVSGGPVASPELASATLVTDGGRDSVRVDLPKLLAGDAAQNLPLAPGDVLFMTPRDAAVAQVQVIGEVLKPGAFSVMPAGSTLLSLVTEAGGATLKAALTQAQVMHGGTVAVYNLRPLLTRDLSDPVGNVRLVPGDVLLIPTNSARILALGEIGIKGIVPIPDGETLPLTVALAQVGGITAEGDKKNVDIVRRDATGRATVLVVNTNDLLKGKNGVPDMDLRSGDILYVQARNHPKGALEVLAALSPLGYLSTLASHL